MIQEKQLNVDRTNTALKEKIAFFFFSSQFVFTLCSIKLSVPCWARPSTQEEHYLIIALSRFFHCNIQIIRFIYLSFWSLVFSQFYIYIPHNFPTSVHSYPYSICARISMLFFLHLCQKSLVLKSFHYCSVPAQESSGFIHYIQSQMLFFSACFFITASVAVW